MTCGFLLWWVWLFMTWVSVALQALTTSTRETVSTGNVGFCYGGYRDVGNGWWL